MVKVKQNWSCEWPKWKEDLGNHMVKINEMQDKLTFLVNYAMICSYLNAPEFTMSA